MRPNVFNGTFPVGDFPKNKKQFSAAVKYKYEEKNMDFNDIFENKEEVEAFLEQEYSKLDTLFAEGLITEDKYWSLISKLENQFKDTGREG